MPPITHTYESYVNPNACCPVCGASVFFYQSPNGGRVFFDELGPPWPKHPCTDAGSVPKQITNSGSAVQRAQVRIYKWQEAGWKPFYIRIVSRVDKDTIKILGVLDNRDFTLYAKSVFVRHSQASELPTGGISHIRKTGVDKYELSAYASAGHTITLNVFLSLIEARKDAGYQSLNWSTGSSQADGAANNSAMAIALTKAISKRNEST